MLQITGRAPDELRFERRDPGTAPPDLPMQARAVLVQLGFKSAEAKAAVTAATTHVGHDEPARDLEALVRAALRYVPKPRGSSA